MVIPEGYKKTEVGIIPEDWDCKRINEFAHVCMCKRVLSEQTSLYYEIPFYKIGTFGKKPDAYIPRKLFLNFKEKYSYPEKGDVLISAAGTLGRTMVFDGKDAYFQDSNIVWLKIDKRIILNEYLFFCFQVIKWTPSEGSTISRLYNGIIESTRIALPLVTEQKRIAKVLSDIDILIDNLEKLVEKKKNIKQGAMQELLTGKRRLPGFDGKWTKVQLSQVLSYEQPTNYIVSSTDYSKTGTPVITAGKSFILGYTTEDTGICSSVPIILFDDFLTLSRYIDFPFKVKSSAVKLLSLKSPNYDLHFIFEIMQRISFPVLEHQRHWISQYSKIEITIPKTKEEQTAIATVLSDMDKEIEELEKKLTKYRNLKQGMMSELLTGHIRLTEKEDA